MSPRICAIVMVVFTVLVNLLPTPTSKEIWKQTGNVSNLVIPLMAGVCAYKQGHLPRYIFNQAVGMSVVKVAKNGYGKQEINRRPNGGSRGVVSGHSQFTATASMYMVANRCHESKWNWILHSVSVMTGYSRVGANAHSPIQALRGLIVGYLSVLLFSRRRTKILAVFAKDLISDVIKTPKKLYRLKDKKDLWNFRNLWNKLLGR